MQFVTKTTGLAEVLAGAINDALGKHSRVIWLLPGGSNIPLCVQAMQLVAGELSAKLVLMQTDERYVPLASADCNWLQLQQAGLDVKQAQTFPMLVNDAEPLENVAQRYANTVKEQFAAADYIIGQFGIGADGHIAGIKPGSPAAHSKQLVAGYQAEDFKRLTLTFSAITELNEAYCFAFGSAKLPALQQLKANKQPLTALPAGVLQLLPTAKLYSDQNLNN